MVTLWRPRDCPVLERGVWVRLQRGFPIEQELGLGDKKDKDLEKGQERGVLNSREQRSLSLAFFGLAYPQEYGQKGLPTTGEVPSP